MSALRAFTRSLSDLMPEKILSFLMRRFQITLRRATIAIIFLFRSNTLEKQT
jgi:hypothetical protein